MADQHFQLSAENRENMGERTQFLASKLWARKNGRLCRRNSVEDPPEIHYNFSTCWKKPRMKKSSAASILDLPEECLVTVFENLEAHEICNAARVCKRLYYLSWNPTLWKSIDLSFQNFPILFCASLYRDTNYLGYCSWKEVIKKTKRRMLFASFLSARKAALTKIRGDFNIFTEADMFICLLNNCNVTNLKSISLQTTPAWSAQLYKGDMLGLQRFLRCLVENCRDALKSLRCYVDVSYTTANLLGSLHSLEYLNLHFPWVKTLPPECMDAILSSLPNLKYLKITIRQIIEDEYFPGYVLRSDSLETLDFGFTKNFVIRDLFLPKLHTLKAECLRNFHNTQRTVCLFELVKKGCPLIQALNDYTSLVPGLQNFHLSEDQKKDLYFCICPIHAHV